MCACVLACSRGCSLESRDLSGLKVIPMSQDSELDADTHTQRLRNAGIFLDDTGFLCGVQSV